MKASRWHLATLTLIMIFAATLRLRHLEYSEIWDDQALVLNIAQGWVSRGIFPLVADKSSFGLMNPPLIEYLYSIPLFIQRDILGVAWLTALANLAALLIAYWALAKVFGPRVALWATLLYAVNPWSVYYSRLILNPTLVPFFGALLLASLLYYFALEAKPIYLSLSLLWLAGVIQTHWTSVVLMLPVAATFVVFRRRLRLRPLLVGMALFLLSFTPYLVYEVIAGYPNLAALREGLSQPATTSLASVLVVLDLLRTEGVFFTLGPLAYPWRASTPWAELDQLVVILLGLSLAYAVVWIARQPSTALQRDDPLPPLVGRIILLLWLIAPILVFLRHSHRLQNYYVLYIYPVPFVFMALLFDDLYRWLQTRARSLRHGWARRVGYGGAALVFLPLGYLALGHAQIDLVGQEILLSGRPGRQQIRHVSAALDTAERLLAERPGCSLVIVSEGFDVETSRLALFSEFLGPTRVRFAQAGRGMVVPDPCGVYLSVVKEPKSETWLATYARPLPEATIRTPAETWRLYDLSPQGRAAASARWPEEGHLGEWENGLRLVAYEIAPPTRPGAELELVLIWRIARQPPMRRYHFFNHLVTPEGHLVSQLDGPGVDSLQWQPNDLLWTWFSLPLPADLAPGRYQIVVGTYSWPELERTKLRSGPDALAVTWIDIEIAGIRTPKRALGFRSRSPDRYSYIEDERLTSK